MPRGGAVAGRDNLRVPTPDEARANGRKGGRASGRARRAKRDMRETFRELLDMPMRPGGMTGFGSMEGAEGKNMTVGEAIAMTMLRAAVVTRSLDSLTAAPGRPTSSNDGRPLTSPHSTVTRYPSMP